MKANYSDYRLASVEESLAQAIESLTLDDFDDFSRDDRETPYLLPYRERGARLSDE